MSGNCPGVVVAFRNTGSFFQGFDVIDWRPWAIVCVVLLACGAGYRVAMAKYHVRMAERVVLPVPLSVFPLTVGDWTGQDRPLSREVEQIAGNDDYINRFYADGLTGEWAYFYIAYSGNPRTMLGHKPEVCYVSAGWVHDSTEQSHLVLPDGSTLPCLVHSFHEPPPKSGAVCVLNYYVLNGVPTNNEGQFAGLLDRVPNIEGNPARYVAQIEVSSVSEASVRKLAAATADEVLARLPDREGKVRAATDGRRAAATPVAGGR